MNKPGRQLAIRRRELLKADQTREVISIYILFRSRGDLEGTKEFFFVLILSFFLVLLSFTFLSFFSFLFFFFFFWLESQESCTYLQLSNSKHSQIKQTDHHHHQQQQQDKNYNKTNQVTGTQAMARKT